MIKVDPNSTQKLYEENVHDLIWTMWWVNEPPLITATQVRVSCMDIWRGRYSNNNDV